MKVGAVGGVQFQFFIRISQLLTVTSVEVLSVVLLAVFLSLLGTMRKGMYNSLQQAEP